MTEMTTTNSRPRVLSGMRPTGKLHLGNYMGALYNWVQLQHQYECYFFIADWHALTTDYADPSRLLPNIFEIAVDFLAAGLDPEKSTIFIQSHVPQHAELHLLFSMFTPLGLLERVPTYKDQQEQLRDKDLAMYGFLGYPLLQSADILLYKPDFVPVGQDQVAHVELTREIARKFNSLYRRQPSLHEAAEAVRKYSAQEFAEKILYVLPEPQVLLTPSPKLPGIDGRKMSKSYGNSILISDHPAFIREKMSRMTNGGQRNPQSQPGDPDICPVGDMHVLFSEPFINDSVREKCRNATIGCSECKELAASGIVVRLHDIRERREALEQQPEQVWDILSQGSARATQRAERTMEGVREVTGLSRTKRPVPDRKLVRDVSLGYSSAHDLSSHSDWWNIDQAFLARNLRDHWRLELVPGEILLKQDSDRVYVTQTGKRVYVTTSRELTSRLWEFQAKVKSHEVLVLLCWDEQLRLQDFVVPQIAYVAAWTKLKKQYKKEDLTFWVRFQDGRFKLELPDAEPIDITSFRGQYGPMN